jgi:transposase
MMPGVPERRTHSYVRHGTTTLFAALDVASGFVIGKCYKRHRAIEFLRFLKEIDAQVPEGLDVHIVMGNYATHKTPKIKAWLARRPHYHVHFTPTSASWINQVERWFAELTRKQIQRGVHTSVRQLEADIRTFIDLHNKVPRPFKWTKSADQILATVKRFCHKAQQTLCGELQIRVTRPCTHKYGMSAFRRDANLRRQLRYAAFDLIRTSPATKRRPICGFCVVLRAFAPEECAK